jgi:hypothetical protein
MNTEVTEQRLDRYFDVTGRALKKVKIAPEKKILWKAKAEDFLDMAQRYYDDAKHFQQKGEWVNAFACLNYAHGWLDAGARLGLFDVGGDSTLFTVDEEDS